MDNPPNPGLPAPAASGSAPRPLQEHACMNVHGVEVADGPMRDPGATAKPRR